MGFLSSALLCFWCFPHNGLEELVGWDPGFENPCAKMPKSQNKSLVGGETSNIIIYFPRFVGK